VKRIIGALVVLVVLGLGFWGGTRIISNLNLGEGNYGNYYVKVADQKKYEAYLKGLGVTSGVNYRFFLTDKPQQKFGTKSGVDGRLLNDFDYSQNKKGVVFKLFYDVDFFKEMLKQPDQKVFNVSILSYVCGINNEKREGKVFDYCREYANNYWKNNKGVLEIKEISGWRRVLKNLVKQVSAACSGSTLCGRDYQVCYCTALGGSCDGKEEYETCNNGIINGTCACETGCQGDDPKTCNPATCGAAPCAAYTDSCMVQTTCGPCPNYIACPTSCGLPASYQPDGNCDTYFCAATAPCCTPVNGTWGDCVNCTRTCVGASCGGVCTGTPASCAVNGTWSDCDINGDRTCNATCGGTCGVEPPCPPRCTGVVGPACIPETGNYTISATGVFSAKSVSITTNVGVNNEGQWATNAGGGVWPATFDVANHPGIADIRTDAWLYPEVNGGGTAVYCGNVVTPRCKPLNCSMLSGRRTILLGESGNFTANITSPGTAMSGEINYYNDITTPGGTINRISLTRNLTVPSDDISTTWTPTAAGNYSVCCRAWTDAPVLAECRPAEFGGIGGAVSACPGPDTCLPVAVTTITPPLNPPSIVGLVIKNAEGTVVSPETGNRNHICQSSFANVVYPAYNPRTVIFELTVSDLDGWGDISSAQISWRGVTKTLELYPNGVADAITPLQIRGTVSWTFVGADNDVGVFPVMGWVSDQTSNSGWQPTGRSWKVWNCEIPVAGTVYEINDGTVCTAVNPLQATAALNYNQTVFTGMGGATTRTFVEMNDHSYSTPPYLEWGKSYGASLNADINGNQPTVMNVNGTCDTNVQLDINQALVDAYEPPVLLTIDFGIERTQSPWWQAVGGGVMANTLIQNNIPSTCTVAGGCTPAMVTALVTGDFSDGVTFGQSITNTSGSTTWSHSDRDIYKTGRSGVSELTNYDELYKKLYVGSGVGVIYTGATTLGQVVAGNGGVGVAFVDGDLNITSGNSVPSGNFLMIVVDGGITIDQGVNAVEGVLISDEDINITGTSDWELNINGSIYTGGTVNISRGYTDAETNNTNAAVRFNYRPDLLFNMPVAVSKVLSNWRVGQ